MNRNVDSLGFASDRDNGRLVYRAAMAIADFVADGDALGLARCQEVKGRVAGVHREHACAVQAQARRDRAAGLCRANLVTHRDHA